MLQCFAHSVHLLDGNILDRDQLKLERHKNYRRVLGLDDVSQRLASSIRSIVVR